MPAAAQSPPGPRVLYTLATQCSLAGGPAQPCTVEAIDEGGTTIYRHRIGTQTIAVRITDSPVTMAIQSGTSTTWVPLRSAGALFSTNSICFNGRELCVVNPNYLNSVRETNPAATAKRDLVKVNFGEDGRINASCYDDGCEVTLK